MQTAGAQLYCLYQGFYLTYLSTNTEDQKHLQASIGMQPFRRIKLETHAKPAVPKFKPSYVSWPGGIYPRHGHHKAGVPMGVPKLLNTYRNVQCDPPSGHTCTHFLSTRPAHPATHLPALKAPLVFPALKAPLVSPKNPLQATLLTSCRADRLRATYLLLLKAQVSLLPYPRLPYAS